MRKLFDGEKMRSDGSFTREVEESIWPDGQVLGLGAHRRNMQRI